MAITPAGLGVELVMLIMMDHKDLLIGAQYYGDNTK